MSHNTTTAKSGCCSLADLPRVPLVFGVVGHRTFINGITDRLKDGVKEILREFSVAYPNTPLGKGSVLDNGYSLRDFPGFWCDAGRVEPP